MPGIGRMGGRLPTRSLAEPTRLQEDQTEPGDEPDRVYEAAVERRRGRP